MTPPMVLLDTDTVSFIGRNHPVVSARATDHRRSGGGFAVSVITRYEALKGLLAKRAKRQIIVFETFCADNELLPLSDEAAVRAANIHAELRARGEPIGDPDVLIAATALTHGLVLVTNNTRHFGRIEGLELQNWMERP